MLRSRTRNASRDRERSGLHRLTSGAGNVPSRGTTSVSVVVGNSGNGDGDRVEAKATEHLLGLDVHLERVDRGVESRDLGNVLVLKVEASEEEMSARVHAPQRSIAQ